MNNNIATIDTDNFAIMSQSMGMTADVSQKKQTSTLNRLKISHSPIMGEVEVKGKKTQAALVNGGVYKLDDLENDTSYYSDTVTIRPYIQRFMYKKYVKPDNENGFYVKTVMSEGLNNDLKDNMGGFNCGKPSGWIEDFNSLPDASKELIRSIKRVRVVLGNIELKNPKDADGNDIEVGVTPFIWEVENRDAFKTVGEVFTSLAKQKRLPVQHNVTLNTQERKLPNGNSFYLPVTTLDTSSTVELTKDDQVKFSEFIAWVTNYNEYIINAYAEKATQKDDEMLDDIGVAEIVDIELEEEVA